jgi:beta-lactamase superfamily II metal-dependent hydrolase
MLRALPIRFYIIVFLILIVGNTYLYRAVFASSSLTVSVLATGEGSAVLVQSPFGGTILLNTDKDAGILRALGTSLPPWQRSIDLLVLTQSKSGAVGGLPDVFERYQVFHLIRFGPSGTKSIEEKITAATQAEGVAPIAAPYGARLTIDGNTHIDILPNTLTISHGKSLLSISSSTPRGKYLLTGETVERK